MLNQTIRQLVTAFHQLGKYITLRNNRFASLSQDAISNVRQNALFYTENLCMPGMPYERYCYKHGSKFPILYASVFGVLLRYLLGDLNRLIPQERGQWIEYINSYQHKDGLFRDSLVSNEIAETEDWWGWRHLTLLALMALHSLGAKPRFPLQFLETLSTPAKVRLWLNQLNWGPRVSFTSNKFKIMGLLCNMHGIFLKSLFFKTPLMSFW